MPLMTDVLHDSVAGCLGQRREPGQGLWTFDDGYRSAGNPGGQWRAGRRPWPVGAAATLVFFDGARHAVAAEHLTIGLRAHASHLMFDEEPRRPDTAIFPGLSPYFAFSVLYDPGRGAIASEAAGRLRPAARCAPSLSAEERPRLCRPSQRVARTAGPSPGFEAGQTRWPMMAELPWASRDRAWVRRGELGFRLSDAL